MTHSNYFSLITAQLDALHAQLSGLCNLTLAAASDTVLTAVQINRLLTPILQTVDSVYDLVDLEAQETSEPTTETLPENTLCKARCQCGKEISWLSNSVVTPKHVVCDCGQTVDIAAFVSTGAILPTMADVDCPVCGDNGLHLRAKPDYSQPSYYCFNCGEPAKPEGYSPDSGLLFDVIHKHNPTNPALQPPTLFDEQLARMKAEAPTKVKPCIEREYVRIENVRSSMGMHPYAPAKIAAVADALLALDGESLTPIVVYKVADNDYELIHGELELLAAHHARDKAPDFEEIVAFVVRDSAGQEAMTRYLDAFLGFQVSPQLDAQEAPTETRPCVEREYISLEDIRPCHAAHMAFYKNDYSYEQVATAANALIALDGNPLTPLVVRELSANEYTLIYGELELLAATYASKINPNFEEVQAFVVRDDVDDKATADYLAAFVGFEKVEG